MAKFMKGLLWTCGILAIVAAVLRLTVLDVWRVPDDPRLSASVAPSLSGGDVVIMLTRGAPSFGDLVRCPDPEIAQAYVVGRIAGFGGDSIQIEGSQLSVNGKNYPDQSSCPTPTINVTHPTAGSSVEMSCGVVEMGGGWHYRATSSDVPATRHTAVVGDGMAFLLSDNRRFHDDSRDYGTVPASSCKDRIVFRLWGKGGWSDSATRLSYIH